MPLLNDPASVPSSMWVVVRYLASEKEPVGRDGARALLSPESLFNGKADNTFDWAVNTLAGLGLVVADRDTISLSAPLADLDLNDQERFHAVMRAAVLAPDRNTGLASESQEGPRDLNRALAWFLTLDPLAPGLGWDEAALRQDGVFAEQIGKPIVNDTRWSRFVHWAPALGFAAADLLAEGRGTKLVPDCTDAVRQEASVSWPHDERGDAAKFVEVILERLPVLPGGRYSHQLGLPAADDIAPSLSFALLRGDHDGWLKLDYRSDAANPIHLVDPVALGGRRRVSEITIWSNHVG
jgi:hypothetical protein